MKIIRRSSGTLILALTLGWVALVQAQSAKPSDSPPSSFAVDTVPFTTEDLARELGYDFHGWHVHFSTPVHVRLKIWSLYLAADVAEDADKHTKPTSILFLREAANDFSVRFLRRGNKRGSLDPRPPETRVDYRGKTVDPAAVARRRAILAAGAEFSNLITDGSEDDESAFSTFEDRLTFKNETGVDYSPMTEIDGIDAPLPNPEGLEKLGEGLSTPEGKQRLAEEKAKWQAYAEPRVMDEPHLLYREATQQISNDDDKQVKQRALFEAVLEFSRKPFTDNEEVADKPHHRASPAPTPGGP